MRDHGPGLPPEIISKLFVPFTRITAVRVKGHGLGLSIVKRAVEAHHGKIEVESQPGRGSTFHLHFPIAQPDASALPGSIPAPAQVPRGTESILLVEDEAPVRAVTSMMLRRLGYSVREARSASHALELWNQPANETQLLLTDMVMPGGMTGMELANTLRKLAPSLPVIITSGYSNEVLDAETLRGVGISFIPKPFEFATLAATVRKALDSN